MVREAPSFDDAMRAGLESDGFFRIDGFADSDTCAAMSATITELVDQSLRGEDVSPALVLPEQQADLSATDRTTISKIFRVAREAVFLDFFRRPDVVALVADVLGTGDYDCFLSQFILKNPGAWGQPWHQDSYYFPFEPARPVIGLWLAVSRATLDNGCLHVLPGSHREPVHEHVPDRREHANYGYVEIIDHDMATSVPVLMRAGDLLVFDSHLMHRSTDNTSNEARHAMVYHFARAGTIDHTRERRGYAVNDWIPAVRGGRPYLDALEPALPIGTSR